MFQSTAAIYELRDTLQVASTEWVLWAMDAQGVFWLHEGPGVLLKGIRPGETVGKSVWELHAQDKPVLEFTRSAFRGPTTRILLFNGYRFWVAGAPDALGGIAGLALALEPAEAPRPRECSVIEAVQPIPEIGAEPGDLLVLDAQAPDQVGLYRTVDLTALPGAVRSELQELSRGGDAGFAPGDAGSGAGRQRRERPAHLRLLP